jgi:hypothetical protein
VYLQLSLAQAPPAVNTLLGAMWMDSSSAMLAWNGTGFNASVSVHLCLGVQLRLP